MSRRTGIKPSWMAILVIIIITLIFWIKRLHYEVENIQFYKNMQDLSSKKKDTIIQKLNHEIDSLINMKIDPVKGVISPIKNYKESKIIVNDSILRHNTIIEKEDSIKIIKDTIIESDTI